VLVTALSIPALFYRLGQDTGVDGIGDHRLEELSMAEQAPIFSRFANRVFS
jgi:hypothetical protein